MISKWNHCFFTVSSCQWYTVWYSLTAFNTDDYIHMNDAGIPVKKIKISYITYWLNQLMK